MKIARQFILFAGIGGIGTIGHYISLIFLVQCFQISPVVATTTGFIVGAIINYMLNYRITFNSKKRHREALARFLLVALTGAIMNSLLMIVGMELFDIHYMIIQVIATGIVLVFNFLMNRSWTFSEG